MTVLEFKSIQCEVLMYNIFKLVLLLFLDVWIKSYFLVPKTVCLTLLIWFDPNWSDPSSRLFVEEASFNTPLKPDLYLNKKILFTQSNPSQSLENKYISNAHRLVCYLTKQLRQPSKNPFSTGDIFRLLKFLSETGKYGGKMHLYSFIWLLLWLGEAVGCGQMPIQFV